MVINFQWLNPEFLDPDFICILIDTSGTFLMEAFKGFSERGALCHSWKYEILSMSHFTPTFSHTRIHIQFFCVIYRICHFQGGKYFLNFGQDSVKLSLSSGFKILNFTYS